MAQTVTPFGLDHQGTQPTRRDPAQVLRECMAAHHVTTQDLADRWGVSRVVAWRILAGERPIAWDRLRSLPRPVLADWCARFGASVEGRPVRGIEGETLDVTVQLGRLADEVRAATADGRLDEGERVRIRDAASKLLDEVSDVLRVVSMVPGVG